MNENLDIRKILPQAYPFLMIDRIVEFEKGKSLVAIKNITANEWYFQSRAEGNDTLPETLLMEAAAQAALCVYQLSKISAGEPMPKYVLGKIDADIKKYPKVGDQIYIKAFANKMLDTGGYSDVFVYLNKEEICKIEVIYSVVRKK